jgi:hypothetical protein
MRAYKGHRCTRTGPLQQPRHDGGLCAQRCRPPAKPLGTPSKLSTNQTGPMPRRPTAASRSAGQHSSLTGGSPAPLPLCPHLLSPSRLGHVRSSQAAPRMRAGPGASH